MPRRIHRLTKPTIPPEQMTPRELMVAYMHECANMAYARPIRTAGKSVRQIEAQHKDRLAWLAKAASQAAVVAPYVHPRLAAVAVSDGDRGRALVDAVMGDDIERMIAELAPGGQVTLIEGQATEVAAMCVLCGETVCECVEPTPDP